jgi:ABC-type uncharacterized transport system ATPase subunit
MQLRGGEITGLAGISGNGQAALAALIAGTLEAVRAKLSSMAKSRPANGRRARRWSTVLAGFPKTAMRPA